MLNSNTKTSATYWCIVTWWRSQQFLNAQCKLELNTGFLLTKLRFIISVVYNDDGSSYFYYVCLLGFMISLPLKCLLVLFFWYRMLFNIFSANYAAISLLVKLALIVNTLLTDVLTIMKIINTWINKIEVLRFDFF